MTNIKNNETINRMKSLMNYGLQTEGKKAEYSSIEYQKLGADGNLYGIIREGQKYYIKTASNKKNPLKEDFQYIGGFRNRKENEYSSFANAQKNFDLKMMAIKESTGNRDYKVESWDLDKKENVVIEATDNMKKEILREMQIMKNATAINEKKAVCCDEVPPMKDNIKKEEPATGESFGKEVSDGLAKGATVCPECGKKECICNKDTEYKEKVHESSEVLGWNRKHDDYMDKSHGTEIGDSAPFDDATAHNIDEPAEPVTKTGEMNNGVVENHGTDMHPTPDQNKPAPGNGEGPSDDNNKPFDAEKGRQIDEALEDMEETDVEGDDFDLEDDAEGDDFGEEGDFEDAEPELGAEEEGLEDAEPELGAEPEADAEEGDDVFEDSLESRMDALEDMIMAIAEKLGVSVPEVDESDYEDDDLFGDEEDNEYDTEVGDENDFGSEDEEEDEVYESRNYRKAMLKEDGITPFKDAGRVPQDNMNKLDDFGKHPAYQKKVMSLPPKDHREFPGYYDMNDDSVKNDTPYGENIGDGAPFDIDPESIDNAIAEAINRFKKKV